MARSSQEMRCSIRMNSLSNLEKWPEYLTDMALPATRIGKSGATTPMDRLRRNCSHHVFTQRSLFISSLHLGSISDLGN